MQDLAERAVLGLTRQALHARAVTVVEAALSDLVESLSAVYGLGLPAKSDLLVIHQFELSILTLHTWDLDQLFVARAVQGDVLAEPALPGDLLIEPWVQCPLSIEHNDVDTGDAGLSCVDKRVINELFLNSHFESPFLLLQLTNDVFHVLLDLRLLLEFEAVLGMVGQLRMTFVLLLTDEHFQMVILRRLQVALHGRQFISHRRLISLDLDEAAKIQPLRILASSLHDIHFGLLMRARALPLRDCLLLVILVDHYQFLARELLLELLVAHLDEHIIV